MGGTQISIKLAPWQVSVEALIPVAKEVLKLLCGGSILDSTHILTAGHCVFDPTAETPKLIATEDFTIRAGLSNFKATKLEEPSEQVVGVKSVRVHPYFNYVAGPGTPDDVAVLELATPLTLSSAPGTTANSIALVASGATPPEGAQVNLTGFGEENANAEGEPNGNLYSLGMTVGFSRRCGGPANALFVCASAPAGSACFGDSGSGLTSAESMVGVADIIESSSTEICANAGLDGFVNVAAPEIRDFVVEGNEHPPLAPQGGGAVIRGFIVVGRALSCEPGSWSNNPTFIFAFINSANGQVLQQGGSSIYPLSAGDVGRTILCQVLATNAGGTGIGRTPALPAIQAAPVITPPPPNNNQTPPPPVAPLPVVAPEPSGVSLGSAYVAVQTSGVALVKLHCLGHGTCHGKLTLTARSTVKIKGRKTLRTVPIGTASFSVAGEQTTTVKIKLGPVGRGLLGAGHGHLSARLAILELEPIQMPSQVKGVQLAQQKAHGKK